MKTCSCIERRNSENTRITSNPPLIFEYVSRYFDAKSAKKLEKKFDKSLGTNFDVTERFFSGRQISIRDQIHDSLFRRIRVNSWFDSIVLVQLIAIAFTNSHGIRIFDHCRVLTLLSQIRQEPISLLALLQICLSGTNRDP